MHERSTVNEKSSLCPSPSPSGGECSGVKPHCAAHSAAPQVRAGHCSCGGQHLRVLQRGLNQRGGFFCFFPTSHLFLLLTAAFFPTKAIWEWCPLKQKPFLKQHYCWKGVKSGRAKDVNLWSTIFLFFSFFFLLLLITECQEMILNVSPWHGQTSSLAQLYREHGRDLHLRTLQWVGPTVSPGGNLKHWTLFLRANESQWCTALYYNVHSNIYRCVIL